MKEKILAYSTMLLLVIINLFFFIKKRVVDIELFGDSLIDVSVNCILSSFDLLTLSNLSLNLHYRDRCRPKNLDWSRISKRSYRLFIRTLLSKYRPLELGEIECWTYAIG